MCLKWLPRELQESFHLFDDVRDATLVFKTLTARFLHEINLRVSDIYVSNVYFAAKHISTLDSFAFL